VYCFVLPLLILLVIAVGIYLFHEITKPKRLPDETVSNVAVSASGDAKAYVIRTEFETDGFDEDPLVLSWFLVVFDGYNITKTKLDICGCDPWNVDELRKPVYRVDWISDNLISCSKTKISGENSNTGFHKVYDFANGIWLVNRKREHIIDADALDLTNPIKEILRAVGKLNSNNEELKYIELNGNNTGGSSEDIVNLNRNVLLVLDADFRLRANIVSFGPVLCTGFAADANPRQYTTYHTYRGSETRITSFWQNIASDSWVILYGDLDILDSVNGTEIYEFFKEFGLSL